MSNSTCSILKNLLINSTQVMNLLYILPSLFQSFHAEVHQYKLHVEELNHLTQDLISSYQADDATKIKKITETINQR